MKHPLPLRLRDSTLHQCLPTAASPPGLDPAFFSGTFSLGAFAQILYISAF